MAELTKFDRTVHAQQHVVTLDVPVDHLVSMQELQSLQALKRRQRDESVAMATAQGQQGDLLCHQFKVLFVFLGGEQ